MGFFCSWLIIACDLLDISYVMNELFEAEYWLFFGLDIFYIMDELFEAEYWLFFGQSFNYVSMY